MSSLPWYLASGAGVVSLAALAVTCYYIMRARTDRAQRDAAQAQAASASDLASRLNASLQTLQAAQSKAASDAQVQAQAASHSASTAGAFLAASAGGVHQAGDPNAPKSQLPAPTRPLGRLYIAGFHRDRFGRTRDPYSS